MAIVCDIVALPDLRLCGEEGFTNVLMAQPALIPRRNEETGYGPSPDDRGQAEKFVDDCLAALVSADLEHNFVIFPEAFVPISRVPTLIEFVESDCPANTVIIAGVESLPVQDVLDSGALPLDDGTRESLKAAREPHHMFVNACLILIRDCHGDPHVYVQPKMHPSHVEQSLPAMLTSNRVLFFTCPQLSFWVLICSDFIQRPSGIWLPIQVVNGLKNAWEANAPATSLPVDVLINIQCNPKPNNKIFLEAAKSLLYSRPDSVLLDQAFILISNWGRLWDRQEPILSSALIYQKQFWLPPADREVNVPSSYSFTRDMVTGDLNIASFRYSDPGRCRFRMLPCKRCDMSDPSLRLPLRDCYFDLLNEDQSWLIQHKSGWHDRCERWLPPAAPDPLYAEFWSLQNGQDIQDQIHAKYVETRQNILHKTSDDLKQDCLCLTLSSDDSSNPDMWGQQQQIALNKWASIATLFHYEDQGFSFNGDDWFSFKWRKRICITIIDGQNLVNCARSKESYFNQFGKKLPQDPQLDYVVLVMLYRHTRDDRQVMRKVTPLITESWVAAGQPREGIRTEALARNDEDVTRPQLGHKLFWCTAEDFDIAWEAESAEALSAAMEGICEPALD
jgi:hypothetical protein